MEAILNLIDRIAQFQNNAAQTPIRYIQELTSVFLGSKCKGLAILIGGEALVLKVVDEFGEKICLKIPRTQILRSAPRQDVAVLKNIVDFIRGATAPENINASRFSEGAILQRSLCAELENTGVKHFSIPRVLRISSDPVLHYTMEWIDSPGLLRWLQEKNDLLYSLHMFKKLLYAANFLHTRGIIHRDIKSDNLLIGINDTVIILDWTMAKVLNDRNLTIPGSIGGTGGYAPPKFLTDGDFKLANYSDDLYMLGFVLWEFLALQKLPYLSRDRYTKKGLQEYRTSLVGFLPEAAQGVFWHATEQEEPERYSNCGEFLKAIVSLEQIFAADTGFIPTNQTMTPTLVLEQPLCSQCGACGGVNFCEALADFIRKVKT